jgi:hypothetical protein
MKKNNIKIAALAVTFAIIGTACSQNKTESNAWGCQYGGGLLDTPALKKTIEPGTKGGMSTFDSLRQIPSDVRNYVLDEDPSIADVGATPLILPAQGREVDLGTDDEATVRLARTEGIAQVSIELGSKFVINELACELDNRHLKTSSIEELNFNAGQGEVSSWATFLNLSWNQKMVEAARPVVIEYDWLQLNLNSIIEVDGETNQVFDILAKRISENLSRELENDLGGNFFCGPSYVFDGNVDGEFENGCPPIEITIKEIKPTNPELLANYQAIVANVESAERILSDKDREITQINADRDKELATEENRQLTETEIAKNDKIIADQQLQARQSEFALAQIEADASVAECLLLASAGIDCALLKAAENGVYPRVILSSDNSSGASVLVNTND